MIYKEYLTICDGNDPSVTNIVLASKQVYNDVATKIFRLVNFRLKVFPFELPQPLRLRRILAGTPMLLRGEVSKVTITRPEASVHHLDVMHTNGVLPSSYTLLWRPNATIRTSTSVVNNRAWRVEEGWISSLHEILKHNPNVREIRPLMVVPSSQFADSSKFTDGEQHDIQRMLNWFMWILILPQLGEHMKQGPWTMIRGIGSHDRSTRRRYWKLKFEKRKGVAARAPVKLWQFEPVKKRPIWK
jgi:hypothetical protein